MAREVVGADRAAQAAALARYVNLIVYRTGGRFSVETLPASEALSKAQACRAAPGIVGAAAIEMIASDNRSMPRINRTLAQWGRGA